MRLKLLRLKKQNKKVAERVSPFYLHQKIPQLMKAEEFLIYIFTYDYVVFLHYGLFWFY